MDITKLLKASGLDRRSGRASFVFAYQVYKGSVNNQLSTELRVLLLRAYLSL